MSWLKEAIEAQRQKEIEVEVESQRLQTAEAVKKREVLERCRIAESEALLVSEKWNRFEADDIIIDIRKHIYPESRVILSNREYVYSLSKLVSPYQPDDKKLYTRELALLSLPQGFKYPDIYYYFNKGIPLYSERDSVTENMASALALFEPEKIAFSHLKRNLYTRSAESRGIEGNSSRIYTNYLAQLSFDKTGVDFGLGGVKLSYPEIRNSDHLKREISHFLASQIRDNLT